MPFLDDLCFAFEREERETVGKAFGSSRTATRKNFSVPSIRDWILAQAPFAGQTEIEDVLRLAIERCHQRLFPLVVASLIRFSFLIELTNLKVGSTKMKTRWVPGRILMPQADSFEPIEGTFQPGNDPRAASFEDCTNVFTTACRLFLDALDKDPSLADTLLVLIRRVPYEFPLSYDHPSRDPVHDASNTKWALTDDLRWLIRGRQILRTADTATSAAVREIEKKKFEVKVFKTDRSLTGKDKTNRAKRWEVLVGDFQHATLEQCWSAEKKLTRDLACFVEFPEELKAQFIDADLIPTDSPPTCCPVTLEPLRFSQLAATILDPRHGVSEYQVGHLHPLKRDGNHDGSNVCWQSANGNRIQGELSIEETEALLDAIARRRAAAK